MLFWQQPRAIHFLIPLILTRCAPPVCMCACDGSHQGAGTDSPPAGPGAEGQLLAGPPGGKRLQPGEGLVRPLGRAGKDVQARPKCASLPTPAGAFALHMCLPSICE